tara:strand:- start:1229 stop:1528 length:300 start_codon:yes stop_codon:yes gene_type:complete
MRNIICDKSGDIICEDMNTDVYRFNERIEDEFGSYSFLYFSFFTKDFFIGDESSGEDFTLEASKKIKEYDQDEVNRAKERLIQLMKDEGDYGFLEVSNG